MASDPCYRLSNGIELPLYDDREVASFVLPNGLKCVVISDVHAEVAACSVQVSVGHFSDPEELPGLAHFLEHMLFMGTKKHPDENSFSAFLNEHGGFSNAYTSTEDTNYHFEVQCGALREALDRFSGFFTCPLLTASAASREVDAVDSENQKNLQNDMWRSYQLDKGLYAGHAFAKFGTGNAETLRERPAAAGVDVRGALVALHAAHYSAGRATLALVGAEPVGVLEAWVQEFFSAFSSNGSAPPVFPPLPPAPGVVRVSPVKEKRTLSVSWPLPPTRPHWRSKPARYVSHLVGHEGPGSLLSHLMARGLATGLYAGAGTETSAFSLFEVEVELSPAGLGDVGAVLEALFAYLGLLDAAGPLLWVWEENASIAASKFRFRGKSGAIDAATAVSEALGYLPPRHALSGGALFFEFDAGAVEALLGALSPHAARFTVTAKPGAGEPALPLKEIWYGSEYSWAPVAPALVARLAEARAAYARVARARAAGGAPPPPPPPPPTPAAAAAVPVDSPLFAPALVLPAPNAFLPTDFSLSHPAAAARRAAGGADPSPFVGALADGVRLRREPAPALLRAAPGLSLWWHQDDFFATPKVHVYVNVALPAAGASPRGAAMADLYVALVTESLRELAYDAELAGLRYSVTANPGGSLSVYVGGFSHRAGALLRAVAEKCAAPVFSDAEFALQHDARVRAAGNRAMDQPLRHAAAGVGLATLRPAWSVLEDVLPALARFTAGALRAALPEFLGAAHARVAVVGNVDAAGAGALGDAWAAPWAAAGSAPVAPSQGGTTAGAQRAAALPAPLPLGDAGGRLCFDLLLEQPAKNPKEPNAAVELFVVAGPRDDPTVAGPPETALLLFTSQVVKEAFFDELRTKQALGYVVQTGLRTDGGVRGFRFLVQSSKLPPSELLARIETFLAGFGATIAAMAPEKFRGYCVAAARDVAEPDKALEAEASRLADEVAECRFVWNRGSRAAKALLALTQAQAVAYFADVVAPGGSRRATLASMIAAGGEASAAPAPASGGEGEEGEGSGEEEEEVGEGGKEGAGAAAAAASPAAPPAAPLGAALEEQPLEAVAVALSALRTVPQPHAAAAVSGAFRSAGLPRVADACEAAAASGAVLRLPVRVARKETVFALLPTWPNFAAMRVAKEEKAL